MTIENLLLECRRRGIAIVPEGPALRVKAPKGALPPDLLRELKERKEELLAALRGCLRAPELLHYAGGPYAGFAWSPDSRRDVARGEQLLGEAEEYAAARMENARALSARAHGISGKIQGAEMRKS